MTGAFPSIGAHREVRKPAQPDEADPIAQRPLNHPHSTTGGGSASAVEKPDSGASPELPPRPVVVAKSPGNGGAIPKPGREAGVSTAVTTGFRSNASGKAGSARTVSGLPAATANFDPQGAYARLVPQLEAVTAKADRASLRSALERYVTAYANFTRENPGTVTGRYGLLVNFGALSDSSGRGYIIDMQNLSRMRGPMPVSHGHGPGPDPKHWQVGHALSPKSFRQGYGKEDSPFSNEGGTRKSSLGVYTTFKMDGKHKDKYSRVGLDGRSVGFNDNARGREIYMHGVPNPSYRTQGCPGFTLTKRRSADGTSETDNAAVQRLLEGKDTASFVFLDAPVPSWHQRDRWLRVEAE